MLIHGLAFEGNAQFYYIGYVDDEAKETLKGSKIKELEIRSNGCLFYTFNNGKETYHIDFELDEVINTILERTKQKCGQEE